MPSKKGVACSCGYHNASEGIKLTETAKKTEQIVGIAEERETLPLCDADCSKCKHTKAYHWEVQTRAGDEPATRFFRCQNCKHTWREYK